VKGAQKRGGKEEGTRGNALPKFKNGRNGNNVGEGGVRGKGKDNYHPSFGEEKKHTIGGNTGKGYWGLLPRGEKTEVTGEEKKGKKVSVFSPEEARGVGRGGTRSEGERGLPFVFYLPTKRGGWGTIGAKLKKEKGSPQIHTNNEGGEVECPPVKEEGRRAVLTVDRADLFKREKKRKRGGKKGGGPYAFSFFEERTTFIQQTREKRKKKKNTFFLLTRRHGGQGTASGEKKGEMN